MKTDNRKTTATVCKKPAARKTSSSGKRRQAGTAATLTGSGDIYRLVTDRIIVALENGIPLATAVAKRAAGDKHLDAGQLAYRPGLQWRECSAAVARG